MFKVFLVDDEELVIKSLKARVNWSEYGFVVVGYALNGAEAFEAIARLKPDVVFTDVRMPGISGLELIKELRDAGSRALAIVVSGYAEFALVQKAINYGAFGYCLKPFDEDEIIGYLKKAKAVLEERGASAAIEILDLIEDNREPAKESLRRTLSLSGIDMESGGGVRAVVSIGTSKLQLDGIRSGVTMRIGFGKNAYLIQDKHDDRLIIDLNETLATGIKGIGISGFIHKAEQIKEAIREAELKAYRYFTKGNKGVFFDEADEKPTNVHLVVKLEEAAAKNDTLALSSLLDEMLASFANGQLHMKHALIVYNQLLSFIHRSEEVLYGEYIDSFEQLAGMFETVQDMLSFLKEQLMERSGMDKERRSFSAKNQTFNAIYAYINENYCNDISIPDISKQFNVNANYISQLFKKETGMTFTEYLTKLRIDYACQLITTTNLALTEIAGKAGYEDYFYFSRIFKRMMGKTPSAYRDE